MDTDLKAVDVTPRQLEVYWGNTCQQSCIYCGAHYSSTIQQEEKRFGKFDVEGVEITDWWKKNPKIEEHTELLFKWFENHLHKAIINNIGFIKLKKAIRLVILGLSEHYTIETMDLDYKKIDNTIKLKEKSICDLFCYRGGNEFNDYQINNFIRLKEHTTQDCFIFVGAMRLNNTQIDKTIEYKKDGLLDYYALEKAGCINLFEK